MDEMGAAEITSIIGSSAGGILGLAICCEMVPEDIIEKIGVKYLSKMVEDLTFDKGDNYFFDLCQDIFEEHRYTIQ